MNQRRIVVDEAGDSLVHIRGLGTLDILVESVVGVGSGHVVEVILNQRMLDKVLDILDLGRSSIPFLDLAFDLIGKITDQSLSSGPTSLSRSANADFTAAMMLIGSNPRYDHHASPPAPCW